MHKQIRLRTFTSDGHEIMEPENGTWYRILEAVRILYSTAARNGN